MSSINFTPTSGTQSGSNYTWSGAANAVNTGTASDASVTMPSGGVSNTLTASGSGPTNQLPAGATIVGLEYGAQIWADLSGATISSLACTLGSTSSSGSPLSGNAIPTSSGTVFSAGGTSSFPPGMSGVTAADVNGGSFTIGLVVSNPGGNMPTVRANTFSLTVYYTPAGGGGAVQAASILLGLF